MFDEYKDAFAVLTHGTMSNEQGEKFHQDMRQMKKRYSGILRPVMMAEYCWSLKRDNPEAADKRDSEKRQFLL